MWRILLAVFPLFSLLSAWRLWWEGPCPAPLIAPLSALTPLAWTGLVAALLWACAASGRRVAAALLLSLALGTLGNVHVLSPYLYEQVFALALYLVWGERALVGALGVLYLLAGFTKFNPHYLASLEFLFKGLEPLLPVLMLGGLLVPLGEMLVALGLMLGGAWRRWAGLVMVTLHLSILALLLHAGWAWTVWPWNLQMLMLGALFFRQPGRLWPLSLGERSNRGFVLVPLLGALLSVPYFLGAYRSESPWGALSIPLAFPLYANTTPSADVVTPSGQKQSVTSWFMAHSAQEVLRSRGALRVTGQCLVERGLVRSFQLEKR